MTWGAMLLNTIKPERDWKGRGELTYASFNDRNASAYFAGPVTDSIGVSLADYTRRSEGYMKQASRTTPGRDRWQRSVPRAGFGAGQAAVRCRRRVFCELVLFLSRRARRADEYLQSDREHGTPLRQLSRSRTRPMQLGVGPYDPQAVPLVCPVCRSGGYQRRLLPPSIESVAIQTSIVDVPLRSGCSLT